MKNFITRALTGIVFVAILVSAIYFHSYYFLGVFSLITGLTLWELYGLVLPEASPFNRFMGAIGGAYLFAATFGYTEKGMGAWIFLPYLLILIYLMVVALYDKGKNPLTHWSMLLFGQAYCAGSFSLLNGLAYKSELIEGLAPMPIFILALFVLIWLNDTGAYLIGSMLGKHRLFARISPKKSWEGFFGGLAVAVLGSQLLAALDPLYSHLQDGTGHRRGCVRHLGRPDRVAAETHNRSERLGQPAARTRRHARSLRQPVAGCAGLLYLYRVVYSKLNVSTIMREVALVSASVYFKIAWSTKSGRSFSKRSTKPKQNFNSGHNLKKGK